MDGWLRWQRRRTSRSRPVVRRGEPRRRGRDAHPDAPPRPGHTIARARTAIASRKTGSDRRCRSGSAISGLTWTTALDGEPSRDIFRDIAESTRRTARRPLRLGPPCGRAGLRVVENFLDMAHFPSCTPTSSGPNPHTEVPTYDSENPARRERGLGHQLHLLPVADRRHRERRRLRPAHLSRADPFVVMLNRSARLSHPLDAIALFIQPMEETLPGAARDDGWSTPSHPHRAPQLRAGDLPCRTASSWRTSARCCCRAGAAIRDPHPADLSSSPYRRWLKEKGLVFGTTRGAA